MKSLLKKNVFLYIAVSLCLCTFCSCDKNDDDDPDDETYMQATDNNGENNSDNSDNSSESPSGGGSGDNSSSAPHILTVNAKATIGRNSNTLVVTFTVSGTVLRAYASCKGKSANAKGSGNTYKATITGLPKERYPSYIVKVSAENVSGKTSRLCSFKFH